MKKIQRVLRHQNLSTTERYVENIDGDLLATLEMLNGSEVQQDEIEEGAE